MASDTLVEMMTRSVSSESNFQGSLRAASSPRRQKNPIGARILALKTSSEELNPQDVDEEDDGDIVYRSCSWYKTTALMLAMYIGMAMLGLPYAFSTMGYIPALVAAAVLAASVQYTGMILWQVCLRHPEARDICDVGRIVLGGSQMAWVFTTVIFLLNNIAVMGLHVVVGGQYLNTVTKRLNMDICTTVLFCGVIAIICFTCSLVRTFRVLCFFATASSACTLVSVVTIIFCLVGYGKPANYREEDWFVNEQGERQRGGEPLFSPWPPEGTTWNDFLVALMGMAYAFIGHTALPSFIYEMKNSRDFPKALWTTTTAVLGLFVIVGLSISAINGSQYMTSPAFGGLEEIPKIITFSLMLPTIVILGAMYASITSRFIFFRLFRGSRHINNHTVKGWASWAGILAVIWTLAFLVSQVVPFFSSLLAVIGAVFDAFFGFIYWAIAWYKMRKADKLSGRYVRCKGRDRFQIMVNVVMLLAGTGLFLAAGSVASIVNIMEEFKEGNSRRVFSCESNAL